jgi:hypothetical protein
MGVHNPTKKVYGSIGAFLCHHPTAPPVEDVDRPSPLDVKQEAALRAVIALRKLGRETADDAVAAFDAEPKLVALTYRWAARDALKRQLDLEAIETDAVGELRRLAEEGIPGLSRDQTRRVLTAMVHVQDLKEQGIVRLPAAIRQQLCRLRRETHLPLETRLL